MSAKERVLQLLEAKKEAQRLRNLPVEELTVIQSGMTRRDADEKPRRPGPLSRERLSEVYKKRRAKKMASEDPCWSGYEMYGTKMKNGKEVPNCVPK